MSRPEDRIRQLSQNDFMTVWPETGEVIPITEYHRRQAEQGPSFNLSREWIAGDPYELVGENQIPAWLRYEHNEGMRPAPVPLSRTLPPPGAEAARRQRVAAGMEPAGPKPAAPDKAPPAGQPAGKPMSLSRPASERVEGAPQAALPSYADRVDALARQILADDEASGANLYAGNMDMARAEAIKRLSQRSPSPSGKPTPAVRPRSPQDAAFDAAVSDEEDALALERALAGDIAGGYRSGQRDWQAEGDLQFVRENGPGDLNAPETDLEVRRRIQRQRGFVPTQQGNVPAGRPVTQADIASLRGFETWADETPGSDRQEQYNPAGYAEWKGQRDEQRRQDNARDTQRYGRGPASGVTDEQRSNRRERGRSEDAVRWDQREVIYRQIAADAGLPVSEVRSQVEGELKDVLARGEVPTADQWASATQGMRDRATDRKQAQRDEQSAVRRERLDRQARMAGGQPTGGVGGSRGATEMAYAPWDRADDLIARLGDQGLTDWQRAGIIASMSPQAETSNPTPLGVAAGNMALAAPVIRSAMAGAVQSLDPAAQANSQLAQQQAIANMEPEARAQLSVQMGQPMGTGHSAAHVNGRWNYWMNYIGTRPIEWREANFRMEMEGLGYSPEQIDEWMKSRRQGYVREEDGGRPQPPAAPPPPPPPVVAGGPMRWPATE